LFICWSTAFADGAADVWEAGLQPAAKTATANRGIMWTKQDLIFIHVPYARRPRRKMG